MRYRAIEEARRLAEEDTRKVMGWHIEPEGLCLRDHFATYAMLGWLMDPKCKLRASQIAKHAYQQADEMLKARGSK